MRAAFPGKDPLRCMCHWFGRSVGIDKTGSVNPVKFDEVFDVLVIGGGHAGAEAATAAARMGASTCLLTQSIETLGQMSCNPAIGGIGKSHLVSEIDALDGVMAHAADRAGIQFRVLNSRKGPAVQATRVQADRVLYRQAVRQVLENQQNLRLFQQTVVDLLVEGGRVCGAKTQMGLDFHARTVVLTTGTFLGGRIHIGLDNHPGGRAGDAPANALAERLRALPFRVDRLKTGTPPRIDGRSVNFAAMERQPGDSEDIVVSYLGAVSEHPQQVDCFITQTNERTHKIIAESLDRSPLYTGVIDGVGPRYCPSIEDKIVRFADRASHQIFVEPEGLSTHELYPNGISTSLPFDVQQSFVRSIKGFEKAHITRPGYAIEYDFFDPRDLNYSLETKALEGLFFAGQINGTTGYEEAAAQGLLAGMNAALKVAGKQSWCPRRDEAYIGVMVDDLISLGTAEPYRMFTSRAEFRLLLRQDNADLRLTEKGYELGVVSDRRHRILCEKKESLKSLQQTLGETLAQPGTSLSARVLEATGEAITKDTSLLSLLRRPSVAAAQISSLMPRTYAADVLKQAEIQAKYEGYIHRQQAEIERVARHEDIEIPRQLNYLQMEGLSNELKEKLNAAKPENLARASRLPGITPAALSLILVYLKKYQESA